MPGSLGCRTRLRLSDAKPLIRHDTREIEIAYSRDDHPAAPPHPKRIKSTQLWYHGAAYAFALLAAPFSPRWVARRIWPPPYGSRVNAARYSALCPVKVLFSAWPHGGTKER